ncbi:MAG: tetratricopeptide repeat protein [Anaerolineales bacterium]|nr:tetratricopeptide repeat protein [Anaerolineales bacterium]
MLTPEVSQEEMMFHQAVEFIEQGKFGEAREALTRLLKTDQNNALYWVWLSAAMETQKERLYCLQTALRLDPQDPAARRGLILMGALPPDEETPPFPLNHPRPWEAKQKLADEKPRPTGFKALAANPLARVMALVVLGVALVGGVIAGFSASGMFDPQPTRRVVASFTPLPSATLDMTRQVQERGPLAGLVDATYTPTVVYAATPYEGVARDAYRGAIRAYERGEWDTVAQMMIQVATLSPGSADTLYFVAESYRLNGRYKDALRYYQEAIEVDPNFAPTYLGRARTNFALNPKKAIMADLDAAINLDPNYGEAFLERGLYFASQNKNQAAMQDLREASRLMPDAPKVYIALSRVEMAQKNYPEAIEAARRANQLDVVFLEGYLVLGMAYRANGDTDQALKALETYTTYSKENSEAFAFLGATYFNRNEYDKALEALNQALKLDRTSSQAYYWRAEIYMAEQKYEKALEDFRLAVRYNQNYYEAHVGVIRALFAVEDYNNGYAELAKIEKMAESDQQRAEFLYYRAISLGNIGFPRESIRDWQAILDLPEEATTEELRAEAQAKIDAYRTATPVPPTATSTYTITPTQTRMFSPTPAESNTPTPTRTPSPTRKP